MNKKIDDKLNSNDELNSIIENYIILIKTMIMAKAIMMYTSEVIKKVVSITQGKAEEKWKKYLVKKIGLMTNLMINLMINLILS